MRPVMIDCSSRSAKTRSPLLFSSLSNDDDSANDSDNEIQPVTTF